MNIVLKAFAVAALSAFLMACSNSGPDLEEEVQALIEDGWVLSDFNVVAEEDLGTEVSPIKEFRFSATVEPKDDLYLRLSHLRGHDILKKLYSADEEHALHGTGRSTLRAEEWNTTLDYEESPWGRENAYRQNFAEGVTTRDGFSEEALVVGTDAYEEFKGELLAEIERNKQKAADVQMEAHSAIDAATAERDELDASIGASSKAIAQMQKDHLVKDNALYEQIRQTQDHVKSKQIHDELKALRAKHRDEIQKAREEHKALVDERNARMVELNQEVRAATAEARRSKLGLEQGVLEMEKLLQSFEEDVPGM